MGSGVWYWIILAICLLFGFPGIPWFGPCLSGYHPRTLEFESV